MGAGPARAARRREEAAPARDARAPVRLAAATLPGDRARAREHEPLEAAVAHARARRHPAAHGRVRLRDGRRAASGSASSLAVLGQAPAIILLGFAASARSCPYGVSRCEGQEAARLRSRRSCPTCSITMAASLEGGPQLQAGDPGRRRREPPAGEQGVPPRADRDRARPPDGRRARARWPSASARRTSSSSSPR